MFSLNSFPAAGACLPVGGDDDGVSLNKRPPTPCRCDCETAASAEEGGCCRCRDAAAAADAAAPAARNGGGDAAAEGGVRRGVPWLPRGRATAAMDVLIMI